MPIDNKSMKLQLLPIHPFLIASFQILTIYAINVNIANISSVMIVLLIALFFTALLFLLFSIITKDIKIAAIVVTFYCFLFFAYGRLLQIVPGLPIAGLVIGKNKYLLPLYALIVIVGTLWIFRSQWCKKYLEGITYFLNVFSLALVMVAALAAITNFDWITFGNNKHTESKSISIEKEVHRVSKNNILQPNVYFVIFDAYASQRVLNKYYDYDDKGVVDALRTRGFSVNENAYSNYPNTLFSFASTLNMLYIHENIGYINAKSKQKYLKQHIEQNKVFERFKSEGYGVVSNNWFGGYRLPNKKHSVHNSDKSIFSDEFIGLVIQTSILKVIEYELVVDGMRQDILSILDYLKHFDVPNKPTFQFTHVMCPHRPLIFNADGSKPNFFKRIWGRLEMKNDYVEQVKFIGKQCIEIVDSIRGRDPSAVIIVQADHGYGNILGGHLVNNRMPPLEFIDAQFGILSAIYLPPGIVMPDKITPINLFSYLFIALFDARLEILPDRAFFTSVKEPYKFFEVSNDLESLTGE